MEPTDSFPPWFREIDHTADIGIKVVADDLPTLFERAAWGTFAMLTDVRTVEPQEARTVEVEGEDRADLMVNWLSELNFLHITQHVLFSQFEIESMSDTHLTATVRGERVDRDRHPIYTEIKAITYHGLEIIEEDDAWRVQVIYDM